MACRLIGARPLSEPMFDYCQLDPWEHISMKINQNTAIFIEENTRETVVCEMASILSRPQCVNDCGAVCVDTYDSYDIGHGQVIMGKVQSPGGTLHIFFSITGYCLVGQRLKHKHRQTVAMMIAWFRFVL